MKRDQILLLALILFVAFLHRGAVWNEFYWDDRTLVLENKLVRSVREIPTIFLHELYYGVELGQARGTAIVDTYRPMTNVAFLWDYLVWGGDSTGFHATNVLIHLFNIVMGYFVLLLFLSPGSALAAIALFAVHPLSAECIHYVSARTDSLTLLFLLFATWFGFRKKGLPALNAVAMAFFYMLGILMKESGLFFILFFSIATLLKIRMGENTTWKLPVVGLGVATGVYFLLRANALGSAKALNDPAHIWEVLINYPRWIGEFLYSFLVPLRNMPMQTVQMTRVPVNAATIVSVVGFYVAMAATLGFVAKRALISAAGWIWMGLALSLPLFASCLTQVMNPRYFYPALIGAVWGCVVGLENRVGKKTGIFLFAVGFLMLSLKSAEVAAEYRTGESFYRAILEGNPHHVEAEYNLANTLYRNSKLDEAISMYKEVIHHQPKHASAWNNVGSAFLAKGDSPRAAKAFRAAISLDPKNERYLRNLARAGEGLP